MYKLKLKSGFVQCNAHNERKKVSNKRNWRKRPGRRPNERSGVYSCRAFIAFVSLRRPTLHALRWMEIVKFVYAETVSTWTR